MAASSSSRSLSLTFLNRMGNTLMHGANKFGLQCLKNLDQLPPQGAVIVAAPLKIQGGSGSPLRVLALVEA